MCSSPAGSDRPDCTCWGRAEWNPFRGSQEWCAADGFDPRRSAGTGIVRGWRTPPWPPRTTGPTDRLAQCPCRWPRISTEPTGFPANHRPSPAAGWRKRAIAKGPESPWTCRHGRPWPVRRIRAGDSWVLDERTRVCFVVLCECI